MEILALRACGRGYRGCLVTQDEYQLFQYTPKRGFKIHKTYPKKEFQDHLHFIAVMQKFISPAAFIVPPAPIQSMTHAELQRVKAIREK